MGAFSMQTVLFIIYTMLGFVAALAAIMVVTGIIRFLVRIGAYITDLLIRLTGLFRTAKDLLPKPRELLKVRRERPHVEESAKPVRRTRFTATMAILWRQELRGSTRTTRRQDLKSELGKLKKKEKRPRKMQSFTKSSKSAWRA